MTTEQKLREALERIHKGGRTYNLEHRLTDLQMADIAERALAQPPAPEQQAPQGKDVANRIFDLACTYASIVQIHYPYNRKTIDDAARNLRSEIRAMLAASPAAPEAAKPALNPDAERAELSAEAFADLIPLGAVVMTDADGPRGVMMTYPQLRQFAAAILSADSKAGWESDAPAGSGGWKPHAEQMESERDYWRARAQAMHEHQRGECWYWQGDGEDHLESMAHTLPIVIRAEQLRELLDRPQQQAKPLTDHQCEDVLDDAARLHRRFTTGVQGQQMSPGDSPNYWIIRATERAHGIGKDQA